MAELGLASAEGNSPPKLIAMQAKVEVYWPGEEQYYPGTVAVHHRDQVYTVHYDDGDVDTVDMATAQWRLVASEAATRRLSSVSVGMNLAIYWPNYHRYYMGVITAQHRQHKYTLRYDCNDRVVEVDLAQEQFRIESDTPAIFLRGDASYEIYWGAATWEQIRAGTLRETRPGWGWKPWRAEDQEHVHFYAHSLAGRTCEVGWRNEGLIYATCFREMGARERKPVVPLTCAVAPKRPRKTLSARASKAKKSRPQGNTGAAMAATSPPGRDGKQATSVRPTAESHYITRILAVARETVLSSLSAKTRDMFGACCWVAWKGVPRPALCLSPFDMAGNGSLMEEWTSIYVARRNARTLPRMQHMVYWYEEGWKESADFKAFSLVKQDDLIPYDVGIARGWDEPPFLNKVQDPFTHGMLTEHEDNLLFGIEQMKRDQGMPSNCRGGPMFFPHLKEDEKKSAKVKLKVLKKKYEAWTTSSRYKRCLESGNVPSADAGMSSLELCAGVQGISKALALVGFDTTTLDNDLKLSATSKLSLGELEERIVNGNIRHHPHLGQTFSVVWSAPECRTWSIAQNGRYRNRAFIDGFQNRALEAHAQQARRDIEALVNILAYYRRRNERLVMIVENPEGYLQYHPVSGLFETVLGLKRVKISYCQFSSGSDVYPQKDTLLWTNSSLLLREFGNREFECHKDRHCNGKGAVDGKHTVQVQDLSNKCSAYPDLMCRFIAGLLVAESVKTTLGHGRH